MMDATECLRLAREALARGDNDEAAQWFAELDEWLSRGGFPPAQWGNLRTKDVVEDIQRELEPNPWRGPRWAGSLTAAEVLGTKLRGDA